MTAESLGWELFSPSRRLALWYTIPPLSILGVIDRYACIHPSNYPFVPFPGLIAVVHPKTKSADGKQKKKNPQKKNP